jgi:Coenzyme PQQ synthesis protein D (PqqD)
MAQVPTLHAGSRVVAARDQVSVELEGEAVILGLSDGVYYGLDPVGATVWALLQAGPHSVAQLRDAVTDEFEVDAPTAEADLIELLGTMLERGLVELRPAD